MFGNIFYGSHTNPTTQQFIDFNIIEYNQSVPIKVLGESERKQYINSYIISRFNVFNIGVSDLSYDINSVQYTMQDTYKVLSTSNVSYKVKMVGELGDDSNPLRPEIWIYVNGVEVVHLGDTPQNQIDVNIGLTDVHKRAIFAEIYKNNPQMIDYVRYDEIKIQPYATFDRFSGSRFYQDIQIFDFKNNKVLELLNQTEDQVQACNFPYRFREEVITIPTLEIRNFPSVDYNFDRELVFTKTDFKTEIETVFGANPKNAVSIKEKSGRAISNIDILSVTELWSSEISVLINKNRIVIKPVNSFDESIAETTIVFA